MHPRLCGAPGDRGLKQVRLPTTKLALLLLGLCHQRSEPAPAEREQGEAGEGRRRRRKGADFLETSPDGEWLSYRWSGPRGGDAMVSVRAADAELVTVLRRVLTTPAAFVELAALLAALAAHADIAGGWAYERVAELLYGRRTANSHRGRETPRLRDWVRLMAEGWWRIDLTEPAAAPKGRKGQRPKAPTRVEVDGPLLTVEGRTVRAGATLAATLHSAMFVTLPANAFLLTRRGHHNPHGNLPSIAARARTLIGAAIVARWRDATGQRVRAEELLTEWAGLDLHPVRERRRVRTWTDMLQTVLGATPSAVGNQARIGPRTEWDEASPLRSLLQLLRAEAGPVRGGHSPPGAPSG